MNWTSPALQARNGGCMIALPMPSQRALLLTVLSWLSLHLLPGSVGAVTAPVELKEQYDVVIAGAGTGGFGAAVQAVRMGASVLLLEETDWIGGQMNAAAVTSMDEGGTLVRERGLYREFCAQVEAYYEPLGKSPETAYGGSHICLEPRVGQKLLYAMIERARGRGTLDVILRATVTKVLKQGDTVTGVVVEQATPSGKQTRTIRSRVLIDATEWGDVIPLTGARYRVGNCTSDAIDPQRKIQMLTWTAVIKRYPEGVPAELRMANPPPGYTDKVRQYFANTLVDGDKVSSKTKPWTWATFLSYRAMPDSSQPGNWPVITRTHMNYNNDYEARIADVESSVSRLKTCRAARLKTLHLLYYVQTALGKADWSVANDEGYDTPFNREQIDQWIQDQPELAPYRPILYHFSVMAYARESRRIIGQHTLTAREIERSAGRPVQFPHTVALGDYAVDLHGSATPALLEPGLDRPEDIPHAFGNRGVGPFAIPFECFIPEKVDGFLPAEKNLSQSRLANGATRLQPSTMLMGQAAGAIAALAVKHHCRPRDVDPVLVQCALLDARTTLLITPLSDVARKGWEWKPIQLVTTRGMLPPDQGKFQSMKPVTSDELKVILQQLFGDTAKPTVTTGSVTRSAFAQALSEAMAVKLDPATMPAASFEPITRLETAQVIALFLELRATARMTGGKESLVWPAQREPTPYSAADAAPTLNRDLQRLLARRVISTKDYWLEHAIKGSQCDGQLVAEFLARAAQLLKPGTNAAQAVDVLADEGIIGSAGYWTTNAVVGRKCDGGNVAILIQRLARRL